MEYIKTFEYFNFNWFNFNKKPKKTDSLYLIQTKLREIFENIDEINKLSHYREREDTEHTTHNHVKRHYELTNLFKEYDFIVQIDGVYKFDIKNFISKSHNQLVNIIDKDRETLNNLIKFFTIYYEFEKKKHDDRVRTYGTILGDDIEYESIFIRDPIINMGDIMKQINR